MIPIEDIPDDDQVFRTVLDTHWDYEFNDPMPAAFVFDPDCSVFWEKYATAEQAIEKRRKEHQPRCGALALNVGRVRASPPLKVQHDPNCDPPDCAHAGIAYAKHQEKLKRQVAIFALMKVATVVKVPPRKAH